MNETLNGAHFSYLLLPALVAVGFWIDWRERRGRPVTPAFKAFFTVGGRRGSWLWTAILIAWCVIGLLPVFAHPSPWVPFIYLCGIILLAGKAMGFWNGLSRR